MKALIYLRNSATDLHLFCICKRSFHMIRLQLHGQKFGLPYINLTFKISKLIKVHHFVMIETFSYFSRKN